MMVVVAAAVPMLDHWHVDVIEESAVVVGGIGDRRVDFGRVWTAMIGGIVRGCREDVVVVVCSDVAVHQFHFHHRCQHASMGRSNSSLRLDQT